MAFLYERYNEMTLFSSMNRSRAARSILVASLPLAVSAMTFADTEGEEHFDIGIWNDGGVLRTGGWDHDTESLEVANLRVYEAHFGEDPDYFQLQVSDEPEQLIVCSERYGDRPWAPFSNHTQRTYQGPAPCAS